MSFPPYAIPATVALAVKAAVFVYACCSKVRTLQTRLCLLFVLCMTVQSLAEIGIFLAGAHGLTDLQHLAGRWWYSAIILGAGFLLHLGIVTAIGRDASQSKWNTLSFAMIYAPIVLLETSLWQTPLLVAGFQPMGYTITKIPGPCYFLIEFQAAGYFFTTIFLFAYGARKQISLVEQLRNKLLLLGFLPFGLLVVSVLVLLHLGYRSFNVTVTGPVALVIFLVMTTYALHHYRLVDVSYYVPWSKTRKRKIEFYERVERTSYQIANANSASEMLNDIANLMHCQVALVGGPSTLVALPEDDALVVDDDTPSEFPQEQLEEIDRIVTVDEVAETNPTLFQLMGRYKVGVIVPLDIAGLPTHWMVLGERVQQYVYTSRDFKIIEAFFDHIAKCFLENVVLLHSYIEQAEAELAQQQQLLVGTVQESVVLKQKLSAIQAANRLLKEDNARRRRSALRVVERSATEIVFSGEKTLEQYLADQEKEIVATALFYYRSVHEAAAMLGITEIALRRLIERYFLDIDDTN